MVNHQKMILKIVQVTPWNSGFGYPIVAKLWPGQVSLFFFSFLLDTVNAEVAEKMV